MKNVNKNTNPFNKFWKLRLDFYLRFGPRFYFMKNIGLDYQSGYLKLYYPSNFLSINGMILQLILCVEFILYLND
jgi:hypothetical protein